MRSGKKRLASIVSSSVLAASGMLAATVARAHTDLTRISANRSTVWDSIATTVGESCGVISDATINLANGETRGDAFDEALALYVLDTPSSNDSDYFKFSADATVTDFTATGDATVVGSCSVTLANQKLSAAVKLTFDRNVGRVVATATVTNEDDQPFTGVIQWYTDFGSDSSTVVELTSSGDQIADTSDRWVITSEGGVYEDESNPVIKSFTNTPGAYLGPYTDINDGDANLVWNLDVTALAPGSSVTLTAGHQLYADFDEAKPKSVPVPLMSNPGLLALAGALGLLGSLGLSRRRKKPVTL